MNKTIVATVGFALLATASCARTENNRVGTTVTTGARVLMNDDAAMVMTNARCEHESACDNVGEGKRYPDHDACRRALFPASHGVVRAEACAAGVDEDKLAVCLAAIRDMRCGAQRTGLEQSVAACRGEELCVVH